MPEVIQIFLDLLAQLVGEGGHNRSNILRNSLEAACWLGLLLISRLKYKNEPDSHNRLLKLGFAAALAGAIFMLSVQLLGIFGIFTKEATHPVFPPIVHALSDFGDILIAGGYMLFLAGRKPEVVRFLKWGLGSVGVVYLATFLWWGRYIGENPGSTFSATWCDWAFRINACFWVGMAIVFLWRNSSGWARYWVCAALTLIFLDDFGKIIDMSYGNVYKNTINPIRSLFHLLAIVMLAYIFIREQASSIKSAFDSLEDIVEARTASLKETSERLEVSLARHIQFTADASHELRTPLTMIMNEIQWAISQRKWPEAYQESLDTAQFAARHMKGLLERLMELAQLDANLGSGKRTDGDLKLAFEESVSVLERLAQSKDMTLHFDLGEEGIPMAADFDQLRQVLLNLGGNAVKYSPEGSNLWINLQRHSGEAVLTVLDDGPGISPEDLPRVFDRFFRGDKTRTEITRGSGLGLAICREIALAHGGDLKAESELGKGSVFTFTLPI